MIVIIPNFLSEFINKRLDEELPEEAKEYREHFFNELVRYYNEHGKLPDNFKITKKEQL